MDHPESDRVPIEEPAHMDMSIIYTVILSLVDPATVFGIAIRDEKSDVEESPDIS